MIEAAKELTDLMKHLPEYTVWILLGLLFYKIVIIGSWFGVARPLIIKAHDYLTREPQPMPLRIGDVLCMVDADEVKRVLLSVPRPGALRYFHSNHLEWLQSAINEKIEREGVKP